MEEIVAKIQQELGKISNARQAIEEAEHRAKEAEKRHDEILQSHKVSEDKWNASFQSLQEEIEKISKNDSEILDEQPPKEDLSKEFSLLKQELQNKYDSLDKLLPSLIEKTVQKNFTYSKLNDHFEALVEMRVENLNEAISNRQYIYEQKQEKIFKELTEMKSELKWIKLNNIFLWIVVVITWIFIAIQYL